MTIASQERSAGPYDADVAILAILPEAHDAIKRVFRLSSYERRGGYEWTTGIIQTQQGAGIRVVLGLVLDRENVPAATFTSKMIDVWRPRDFLLVDIGGGVQGRDNLQLGDVVTHTQLHYYPHHKVDTEGHKSLRFIAIAPPSTQLRELSRRPANRGDVSWIEHVGIARPGPGEPKVLPGEMLVGGAIQADSPELRQLLIDFPKALVVETEGVGVARGILDSGVDGNRQPNYLVIRGISDFCNVEPTQNQATRDRWKPYAAATAAAHARAIVIGMDSSPEDNASARSMGRRFSPPTHTIDNLWVATRTALIGRDVERRRLAEMFGSEKSQGEIRPPRVICGEPGMGKSVLAREIAEEVARNYAARWWIDASDALKIRVGLREFARQLGIPSAGIESFEDATDETETHRFLTDLHEALEDKILGGRVLFVLDNVDDAELKHNLEPTTLRYLPQNACDVLITSQSSKWHPVAPLPTVLRGLDPITGAKLIARESDRSDLADNDAVRGICADFSGRPLFLKQIASLLRDGEDPRRFREFLRSSLAEALESLPGIEGFEPLWWATYRLAIERAERARPGARRVLEMMSFFSPEPVPLILLRAGAEARTGQRPTQVDAALSTLTDRSLIESLQHHDGDQRSYVLHRVVAALVRMDVRSSTVIAGPLDAAVSAVTSSVPDRNRMRRPEGRQTMVELAPHVDAVADHVLEHADQESTSRLRSKAAEACSLLGLYRRTLSEWAAAQQAHEKAVRLSDPTTDPIGAALRRVRLANVMRQRGLFAEAQPLLQAALSVLREQGDRRDYAWALTVQARTLRAQPDSASVDALALLDEAAALLKDRENDGDPTTIRQTSELHGYKSVVNRLLSHLDVAEFEAAEGLRIISGGRSAEEVLDATDVPDEALVATHLRALGGVWRLRGDFDRAQRAHERALRIFEHVYGPEHTDVGRALDSLGRVQREWGDLEGALRAFARAGEISDLQFGFNYPHAGTAAVNTALVYLELADAAKALVEAEKGLLIYRIAYDEKYDDQTLYPLRNEATVWAVFVRASALAGVGELSKAKRALEVVLNWRKHRYGLMHAHVASAHFALGDVLVQFDIDKHKASGVRHHRKALAIRMRVFNERPDYWLAQSQARVGMLTNDIALLRRARDTFAAQLKPGHWRTREVEMAIGRLEGSSAD